MIDSSAHHSPTASPWQRLIQGGRAVGFMRQMGQSDYYSTDGYGWTGQTIPHDRKLPGLGFRSHDGGRLYHGDVVTYIEVGAQDSRPELRILWVDDEEEVWLATPNSNRIERFKPRLVADRDTQIRSVVNSAYTQPQMWTLFERSHNQLFNVSKSPNFWGAVTGVWMVSGLLISVGLQLAAIGGVGPILSLVGAEVGCIIAMNIRSKRQPEWRTRPEVLDMARPSGLTFGVGLGVIYLLLSLFFGMGLNPSTPQLPVGIAAMAVLGILVGAGLPVFTASVLGYQSTTKKPGH